jgi:UDP-N-acetylmuramoylalanine--D-glutamate ligase
MIENNMKIAVIGFGVTGQAICRYFSDQDVELTVFDKRPQTDFEEGILNNFSKTEFVFEFSDLNEDEFDLIMVSPGVFPASNPFLVRAKEKNIPIKNDVMLFVEEWRKKEMGPIVGITGSNGKTTLVNLLYHYLQKSKIKSILGGNVGQSSLDKIKNAEKGSIAVLELSSAQLELFGPEHYLDICLISNLTPNHLDKYDGSMDKYAEAKMRGIDPEKTEFITCCDDEGIKKYVLPKLETKKVSLVSFETPLDQVIQDGVYIDKDNDLVISNNQNVFKVFENIDNRKLIGIHNLYNIGMIFAILNKLKVDVSKDQFIREFEGLEHRIEFVREIDEVKYINDSKSSAPDATRAAIEALAGGKNIILIMGGNDKGMTFDLLIPYITESVKKIYLMPGDIDEKIKKTFADIDVEIEEVKDLVEAVSKSKEIAEKGDIVLLSPSSTSFKLYKNYEQRGEHFKEIVNNL